MPLFATLAAICFTMQNIARPQDSAAPLPAPPMQGKPWTPPATRLSSIMVDSIGELFDQGLADPRGCEYREVEIDPWGYGQQNMKVHAWVLPSDGKTKYAVGWNGRVVPVVSVGAAVDLRKDFSAETHGLGLFGDARWGTRDFNMLSEKQAQPLKVALLLRLGEADLAEGVWREGYKNNGNMLANDPYSDMARDWLDGWYYRAMTAHLNGDDKLALAMFRGLLPLRKMVEAAADKHGVSGLQPGQHYLEEFRQLDDLAADQERRAKEPPHVPALKANLPDGPERIAALVRDLELVHGEQMMNPGETELTMDPIVQALIKEGEPAVEPLIACLDEDPPRMTHTMFTQGMMGEGPVEYVYEPAYVILTAILKTTMLIPLPKDVNRHQLPLDTRKALAAKFRDYWAKYKSMPPEERWFSVLADDNASPREWLEAAGNIVQRASQSSRGPTLFSGEIWGGGTGDPSIRMRGEALRTKTNPSVSDLLVKRFKQLLPESNANDGFAQGNAGGNFVDVGGLLFDLADWDGKARVDDIRDLTKQFNEKYANASIAFNSGSEINAMLYQKRLDAGDETALAEYAAWVTTLDGATYSPENVGVQPNLLTIMWEHPDAPEIQKAAQKMFGSKDAPWRPHAEHGIAHLLNTPMLGFAVFREQVLRALDDTTDIGYCRRYRADNLDVRMNDQHAEEPRPDAPPKVTFRMCDYYAQKLSEAEIFPQCELDWPLEKRDAAIARCKILLKQYGDAFKVQAHAQAYYFDKVMPRFSKADHPATADDVAQGRAIFSLPGDARLWPMPALPLFADRPGSKQDPQVGLSADSSGKSISVTTYTTNGTVWQAEEVMIDGKWQRFYGFSGRHQLEKVAAEEIEFPSFYPWVRVTGFIDAELLGPKVHQLGENEYISAHVVPLDAPLGAVMKLRNHSGLPKPVPGELMLPANAAKALPAGVSLSLSYSEKIPPDALKQTSQPPVEFGFFDMPERFDYGEWHELALRKEIATADKTAGAQLDAANELTVLQIELRDYFDISRAGSYRLVATFHAAGEKEAKSEEIIFTLVDKKN